MTDPASAIKRELDNLITQQIATLRRKAALTNEDLEEYHTRSVKLDILFRELDRSKPAGAGSSQQIPHPFCDMTPNHVSAHFEPLVT